MGNKKPKEPTRQEKLLTAEQVIGELTAELELAQSLDVRREAAHMEQTAQLQKELASMQARVEKAEADAAGAHEKTALLQAKEAELAAEQVAHAACRELLAGKEAAEESTKLLLTTLQEQDVSQKGEIAQLQQALSSAQREAAETRAERDATKANDEATIAALRTSVDQLSEQVRSTAERLMGAERQRDELQALGVAQHQTLEEREAELAQSRSEHEATTGRLEAAEARCKELEGRQAEARQRHEAAEASEKRAAVEHAQNERRAARVELLLDEMHARIALKEQRDAAWANAAALKEQMAARDVELGQAQQRREEAARREQELQREIAQLHDDGRRLATHNAELQTNVTLISQMGELDKLVALLKPGRRPGSAGVGGRPPPALLMGAAEYQIEATNTWAGKHQRMLEARGKRFQAELQGAPGASARQGRIRPSSAPRIKP